MNFEKEEKTVISKLKDIINPQVYLAIEQDKKWGKVILEEPRAKLKKVTIIGFEYEKTFAFKLDAKEKFDPNRTIRISEYLNPHTENINKGCDGIIFTYLAGKGYVFICEMKSEVPQKIDYIQQFRNSSVFINFMNAILHEFYRINIETFPVKYILFDKKKSYGQTPTNMKIASIKESYDDKELFIYRIHHPNEKRSLNIKLLT